MTRKENIRAILECYFTGFKDVMIDSACERICELVQEPTAQDKQVESEKYQKAFDDGYANGYAQARFDYEQEPCTDAVSREAVINLFKGNIGSEAALILHKAKKLPSVNPQPCDDAISRDAVIKGIEELKKSPWATDKRGNGFEYLITEALDVVKDLCIKQLPSVTQKSGKWIAHSGGGIWVKYYECSECGRGHNTHSDYCPNCGCCMIEPQESEDKHISGADMREEQR